MKQSRAELSQHIANHAFLLFGSEEQPWEIKSALGASVQSKDIQRGAFEIKHSRISSDNPSVPFEPWELLDIWHGNKVISLNRRVDDNSNETGWGIVSMKRGDWERAFLAIPV